MIAHLPDYFRRLDCQTIIDVTQDNWCSSSRNQSLYTKFNMRERNVVGEKNVVGREITFAPHIDNGKFLRAFESALNIGSGYLRNYLLLDQISRKLRVLCVRTN